MAEFLWSEIYDDNNRCTNNVMETETWDHCCLSWTINHRDWSSQPGSAEVRKSCELYRYVITGKTRQLLSMVPSWQNSPTSWQDLTCQLYYNLQNSPTSWQILPVILYPAKLANWLVSLARYIITCKTRQRFFLDIIMCVNPTPHGVFP